MAEGVQNYIWRCAKCSNHFSNIHRISGMVKLEKKCPKCKSINILTLINDEINIQCKYVEENGNDFGYRQSNFDRNNY